MNRITNSIGVLTHIKGYPRLWKALIAVNGIAFFLSTQLNCRPFSPSRRIIYARVYNNYFILGIIVFDHIIFPRQHYRNTCIVVSRACLVALEKAVEAKQFFFPIYHFNFSHRYRISWFPFLQ